MEKKISARKQAFKDISEEENLGVNNNVLWDISLEYLKSHTTRQMQKELGLLSVNKNKNNMSRK